MGRLSEEDRPNGKESSKRHKKDKHKSRERSRDRNVSSEHAGRDHRRDEKDHSVDANHKDSRRESKHRSITDREKEKDRRDRQDKDRHPRSRSRDRKDRPRELDRRESDRDHAHRDKRARTEEDKEAAEKRKKEKEAADLDDDAVKRRQRVALWQEQRRAAEQAEEAERKKREEAAETWTLDDDFENEHGQVQGRSAAAQDLAEGSGEVDPLDAFMAENDAAVQAGAGSTAGDEEEVDPLDAFMADLAPTVRRDMTAAPPAADPPATAASVKLEGGVVEEAKQAVNVQGQKRQQQPTVRRRPRYYDSESSGEVDEEFEDSDDEEWAKNVTAGKMSKSDKLGQVDHSTINYPPFRRSFYIEADELKRMTEKQVADYRMQLEDVKVRGKDVPRPVKTWNQCGLSGRVMEVIHKSGFEKPMPIQAQGLPVIMSGRDCIGIAKTGSGKTVAFVLPMLRHIKAQRPLEQGDGPIGLVMAPTRELVTQIGKDVRKFARAENLTCVTVYGGSQVAGQITELKRGCEIVVCTPGRMIDVLVTSGGKISNLRRVTYLVLDEADRMFDMGFEPQITRIVGNIRPDRQTVMFSATFPRSVEAMARQTLKSPVEIQVGGRSVVNEDITQYVEIRQPEERFMRLLELLGEWQEQGKILVFVNSQEQCDKLFRDLLQVSYACLSLHGGKDQMDRESTIHDFKTDVCNLLIATSVAARGLDVKDLIVVINYDPPNHHEDYIHRVGRTGRAGNKGTAYTFICEEEEKFAPDLVKALQESNAPIPRDLLELAESFNGKRARGEVQARGSGYGGSGFKFDAQEEELRNADRKAAAREARLAAGLPVDDEEEAGGDGDGFGLDGAVRLAAPQISFAENAEATPEIREAQQRAKKLAETMAKAPAGWQGGPGQPFMPNGDINPLIKAAQEAAAAMSKQAGIPVMAQSIVHRPMVPTGQHYEAEIEINDFPQHARWKVTHRDTLADLNEQTGAAVTTKGFYQPPGHQLPEGERKIYLHIEGNTEGIVKECKRAIKRILEESTERAMRREQPAGGRYQI